MTEYINKMKIILICISYIEKLGKEGGAYGGETKVVP